MRKISIYKLPPNHVLRRKNSTDFKKQIPQEGEKIPELIFKEKSNKLVLRPIEEFMNERLKETKLINPYELINTMDQKEE